MFIFIFFNFFIFASKFIFNHQQRYLQFSDSFKNSFLEESVTKCILAQIFTFISFRAHTELFQHHLLRMYATWFELYGKIIISVGNSEQVTEYTACSTLPPSLRSLSIHLSVSYRIVSLWEQPKNFSRILQPIATVFIPGMYSTDAYEYSQKDLYAVSCLPLYMSLGLPVPDCLKYCQLCEGLTYNYLSTYMFCVKYEMFIKRL